MLEKLNKFMLELSSQLVLLKTIIDEVHPLSTKSCEDFSAKRKEVLTVAGERERYLYFVI